MYRAAIHKRKKKEEEALVAHVCDGTTSFSHFIALPVLLLWRRRHSGFLPQHLPCAAMFVLVHIIHSSPLPFFFFFFHIYSGFTEGIIILHIFKKKIQSATKLHYKVLPACKFKIISVFDKFRCDRRILRLHVRNIDCERK